MHSLRARGDSSIGIRWARGYSHGIANHYNLDIIFICGQSAQRYDRMGDRNLRMAQIHATEFETSPTGSIHTAYVSTVAP